MKLRIMQQGGGLIYTPFIPGAQSITATASKSSSSNDDPKLDPLDKELISLMKDQNLLSSDIQQIYDRLIRFQKQTQRLSGLEGTDAYRSAMPGMLQILGMVNEAKSNKEDAKEVEERMISENAGSDIALDNYGRMYVLSDGKLDTVAISKFDPEKHQALSNSQMLFYRENELPFDKSILSGLRNMVGMSSISKEIERMIKAIGTKEESQYITANANVKKVLSAIADGPDGIYKLSAKERSEGLQPAWKAIYDNLPKNMQNVIRANAAVAGTDYRAIIQDMVLTQTDTKFDVNYDSTISKAAGYDVDPNKTQKESQSQVQDTYLYRVASLNGPRKQVALAPKGAAVSDTGLMLTTGITNGAVVKTLSDGRTEKLGSMSLPEMLRTAEAVKAADSSTIVLGNKVLSESELGAVMFDGNTECNTVLLPYTYDRGRIVPDFDTFEKFNQLQAQISGRFDLPITEIDRLARNLGLNSDEYEYDANTNSVVLKRTMYFLSFGAIVNDRSIELSKDNKRYLEKLDDSEGKHYSTAYDNMLKYGKMDRKKSDMKVGDYRSSGTHWGHDFYKGLLWMAMPDAYRGAHLSMNEYIDKSTVNNFGRRTEMREQQIGLNGIGNEIGSFKYE